MYKKSTAALAAVIAGAAALASAPSFAADAPGQGRALRCDSPVLEVSKDSADARALFTIECEGATPFSVTPRVTFAGQVATAGNAPYLIEATYNIDARTEHERALGIFGQAQQTASGTLRTSTDSLAILPAQFASQVAWDAQYNILSVQEQAGLWHAYSVNHLALDNEAVLVDAGYATAPIQDGHSQAKVAFDQSISRFSAGAERAPVVDAKVGVRDGRLEVLIDPTRQANKASVQEALRDLDKKGSDMERAWALASSAKFLGLSDEVRYAEKKVAANNPHLLEEFQFDLRKISQYQLLR